MQYKVTRVGAPREWTSQHGGVFLSYLLDVEGADKPVELSQKPETPAPTVGQSLDLELSPHPRFEDRLKAKKIQAAFGGGGAPRPEDPVRSARILRQHSQEMALRYLVAKGVREFTWDQLMKLVDAFDADVQARG